MRALSFLVTGVLVSGCQLLSDPSAIDPPRDCRAESDAELCSARGAACGALTTTDACGDARTVASCGSCAAPESCGGGGAPGVCGCTPASDAALCFAAGKDCGTLGAVADGCGGARDVVCGTCTGPERCGGGGTANVCGCTPETDAALCADRGAACGALATVDSCGGTRSVASCGACAAPESCGGGGTANACGCTPATDAELCLAAGKDCGTLTGVADGCGGTRDVACGSCTAPGSCGGGGTANVCGCTPGTDAALCAAAGKDCGTIAGVVDGCGVSRTVSCGSCTEPNSCGGGGTPNVCGCAGQSDAALCAAEGKECGAATVTDACGVSRSVQCGGCADPEICGGTGTPNVCGFCAPETDAQLCDRVGSCSGATCTTLAACAITATDNCGTSRSVSCGGRWLQRSALPAPAGLAYGAGGFADGKLVFAGGYNPSLSTAHRPEVYAYDPATNTWTQKGSRSSVQSLGPAYGVVGGKLLVAGGFNGSSSVGDVYSYDLATDTWELLPGTMPGNVVRSQLAGAVLGNRLYANGGYHTSPFSLTQAYEPGTGWTQQPDMPQPRGDHAAAALAGKLWVVGGVNDAGFPSAIYAYDPSTDTWSTPATIPEVRRGLVAAAIGGKLYVVGGERSDGATTGRVDVYDPGTGSWSTGPPKPTAVASPVAAVADGALWIVSGRSGTSSAPSYTTAVEAYCP